MQTTRSTILTWLFTNLSGSLIAAAFNLQHAIIPGNDDFAAVYLLFFICGSILSLPAVIFTYFILDFAVHWRTEKAKKLMFVILAVPIYISLSIIALYWSTQEARYFNLEALANMFVLIAGHFVSAIVFTTIYADILIKQSEEEEAEELKRTTMHKL